MISEQQYRQLKREHEEAKAEAEQAKGALAQLTEQLEEEFGCTSLKQAEAKLAELKAKQEQTDKEFQKALKSYEAKWGQE